MNKATTILMLGLTSALAACDYHNPADTKQIVALQKQVKALSLKAKEAADRADYLQGYKGYVDDNLAAAKAPARAAEYDAFQQRMRNRVEADERLADGTAEGVAGQP